MKNYVALPRPIRTAARLFGFGIGLAGCLAVLPAGAQSPAPTAVYQITVETLWSAATHPTEFPSAAHFSGFIGATHNSALTLWAPGQPASTGIKDVAEIGSPFALIDEINVGIAAANAETIVESAGFVFDTATSSTNFFDVSISHPLLSIVTMLAPSPDWFTGLRDFNLMQNGDWVTFAQIDVDAYDAGTDSGTTYLSGDLVTNPPDPITRIDGPPLENQGTVAPVLRVTLRRVDVPICEMAFSQAVYGNGDVMTAENWRIANFAPFDRNAEYKAWLRLPDVAEPISIVNIGADGSFLLPGGTDLNLGPSPISTVDATLPRGVYELGCRILDPITGQSWSFGVSQTTVQ